LSLILNEEDRLKVLRRIVRVSESEREEVTFSVEGRQNSYISSNTVYGHKVKDKLGWALMQIWGMINAYRI
jgi:hypothetical protein